MYLRFGQRLLQEQLLRDSSVPQKLQALATYLAEGKLTAIEFSHGLLAVYADKLLETKDYTGFWNLYRQLKDTPRKAGPTNGFLFYDFTGYFLLDCFLDKEKTGTPDSMRAAIMGRPGSDDFLEDDERIEFLALSVARAFYKVINRKSDPGIRKNIPQDVNFSSFADWLFRQSEAMNVTTTMALNALWTEGHPATVAFLEEQKSILEGPKENPFCLGWEAFAQHVQSIFANIFTNPEADHGRRLLLIANRIKDKLDLKAALMAKLLPLIDIAIIPEEVISALDSSQAESVKRIQASFNTLATLDIPNSPWGQCLQAALEVYHLSLDQQKTPDLAKGYFFKQMKQYPAFAPFMEALKQPAPQGVDVPLPVPRR